MYIYSTIGEFLPYETTCTCIYRIDFFFTDCVETASQGFTNYCREDRKPLTSKKKEDLSEK